MGTSGLHRAKQCSCGSLRLLLPEELVDITELEEREPAVASTGKQCSLNTTIMPLISVSVPEKGEASKPPILVDSMKEIATGLGPLRVALKAVCTVSAESEVCLRPST